MKLTMPMPPNNLNARRHWRVALKEKKAYWSECDMRVMARLIPMPPEFPAQRVRLSVTMYVGNYHDPDNAMARLKPACDWLTRNGYITDDGRKHMEWAGIPEQIVDRKNTRIELTIETLEAA